MSEIESVGRPQTSTRDPHELHRQLVAWLATRVRTPEISELVIPESNGMSSETLLFDACWSSDGGTQREACAARLAPAMDASPVFPVYDMQRQFRVMQLVREQTSVPVPRTLWYEPDESHLGTPFFVMERVAGEVPPDLMPYTYSSWLTEATAGERHRLQESSVRILAGVHAIEGTRPEAQFLALPGEGASALRRHMDDLHAYYAWVISDGVRSPLLERAFGWLEDHCPRSEGPAVLSWGDSRIGNVLYREFEPVAVLDWEMAALGPREIDLGWMIFMHRFFQDLTEQTGLVGLPDFLRRDDVATTYEAVTGHSPRDLDFYLLYAAVRHGAIMARVARRAVHFGDAALPDDPDDLILHRATIEAMLDGSYWAKL